MDILVSLQLPWPEAIRCLFEALSRAGLQITRCFDLQPARASLADSSQWPCPCHGTSECTCQYLVLLVGHREEPPPSVIVHGHERWTYISIVQPAEGIKGQETMELIRAAITGLAPSIRNPFR